MMRRCRVPSLRAFQRWPSVGFGARAGFSGPGRKYMTAMMMPPIRPAAASAARVMRAPSGAASGSRRGGVALRVPVSAPPG